MHYEGYKRNLNCRLYSGNLQTILVKQHSLIRVERGRRPVRVEVLQSDCTWMAMNREGDNPGLHGMVGQAE